MVPRRRRRRPASAGHLSSTCRGVSASSLHSRHSTAGHCMELHCVQSGVGRRTTLCRYRSEPLQWPARSSGLSPRPGPDAGPARWNETSRPASSAARRRRRSARQPAGWSGCRPGFQVGEERWPPARGRPFARCRTVRGGQGPNARRSAALCRRVVSASSRICPPPLGSSARPDRSAAGSAPPTNQCRRRLSGRRPSPLRSTVPLLERRALRESWSRGILPP